LLRPKALLCCTFGVDFLSSTRGATRKNQSALFVISCI
jgi:hypothetical protein